MYRKVMEKALTGLRPPIDDRVAAVARTLRKAHSERWRLPGLLKNLAALMPRGIEGLSPRTLVTHVGLREPCATAEWDDRALKLAAGCIEFLTGRPRRRGRPALTADIASHEIAILIQYRNGSSTPRARARITADIYRRRKALGISAHPGRAGSIRDGRTERATDRNPHGRPPLIDWLPKHVKATAGKPKKAKSR